MEWEDNIVKKGDRYCSKCNTKLNKDDKKCPKCGSIKKRVTTDVKTISIRVVDKLTYKRLEIYKPIIKLYWSIGIILFIFTFSLLSIYFINAKYLMGGLLVPASVGVQR